MCVYAGTPREGDKKKAKAGSTRARATDAASTTVATRLFVSVVRAAFRSGQSCE